MITFLQVLIFFSYLTYLYYKTGVLSSISASSYALDRNERLLFYVFCVSLGGLNLLQGMGPWGFLTGAGLCFTGTTLNHRRELTGKVHIVSTIVTILSALVGLWIIEGMWLPFIIVGIGSALLTQVKNSIWWIEILTILTVLVAYTAR